MSDGFLNSQTLPIENSQETDWCKVLWVAVLERAVMDAFFPTDHKESAEALKWIDKENEDFQMVCRFAGLEPEFVYEKLYVKIKLREKFLKNFLETRDAKEVAMRNKLLAEDRALPIEEQKYDKNKMMLKLLNIEDKKLEKDSTYKVKYDKNNPNDMKRLEVHAIDECIMNLDTDTINKVEKVEEAKFTKELQCLNIR